METNKNMNDRTEYFREQKRKQRAKLRESVDTSVDKSIVDNPVDMPCPEGHDPKIWAYACERAARARRYATRMPDHIRPSDVRFQSPAWQYANQARYPLPA